LQGGDVGVGDLAGDHRAQARADVAVELPGLLIPGAQPGRGLALGQPALLLGTWSHSTYSAISSSTDWWCACCFARRAWWPMSSLFKSRAFRLKAWRASSGPNTSRT
jgi:hypothetical protein